VVELQLGNARRGGGCGEAIGAGERLRRGVIAHMADHGLNDTGDEETPKWEVKTKMEVVGKVG
jgi:hypothetical protein